MTDLHNRGKAIQPYKRIGKGAKTIHPDGRIADGPFAELKEYFAGYDQVS
ncbi:MAG TPA: hypothetical protein VD905_15445 [Flavobacteriales bacterium]|nr:hypothetical protein [Flavobacteriales bacterium]